MDLPLWVWFAFIGGVLAMLAVDLGVFHRKAHVVTVREAAIWTGVWVSLALLFGAGVWSLLGQEKGLEFLTGYLLEKSLAVDNIFVFVMVFAALATPPVYQHRVLFWGVIGALGMRGGMIFAGVALIERFHWILYLFGAFLLVTGVKMLFQRHDVQVDLEKSWVVRSARRFFRVSDCYDGQRFFTIQNGVKVATPLLLVLLFVEFADLVFAVDSIPAIFAVTTDPFIVFTSNVLAILGLRSMYFLLAGVVHRFVYLKTGLSAILLFIGAKMLLLEVVKIPVAMSLGVVAAILTVSILASLLKTFATEPPRQPLPRQGPRGRRLEKHRRSPRKIKREGEENVPAVHRNPRCHAPGAVLAAPHVQTVEPRAEHLRPHRLRDRPRNTRPERP